MSRTEWTTDPWHDKYFGKSAPEFYYEPKTDAQRAAYIKKWENYTPKTGDEWCLKQNYELWKRKQSCTTSTNN